jgi:hypothetical protein
MVLFPDAAATVISHLADNLAAPIHGRVPNPRPDTFVVVQRVGGPKRNIVTDEATLIAESWAETPADAHDLAQNVRELINDLPGQIIDGVPVYRVEEASGPGWLPDPESQQARYTQTFSVALRGT